MKWPVSAYLVEFGPECSLPCLDFQSPHAAVERGIQRGKQLAETFTIDLWIGVRHGLAPPGQGRVQREAEHFVAPFQQAFLQHLGIPGGCQLFRISPVEAPTVPSAPAPA